MRARLSWIGAIPHVVVTLLMIVIIVDMLVGVFLRYVMTWVSATFDLPSIRFFWVEEVGEWSLAWLTFIGAALGVRRGIHFAVHLLIDKLLGRIPVSDPALPAQGEAKKMQLVIEAYPRGKVNGLWSEDLKPKLRRSNALEVCYIRKKRKHLLAGQRKIHGGL